MPRYPDMSGQRFGKLTIVAMLYGTASGHTECLCQCDCGATHTCKAHHLREGRTASCGCALNDVRRVKAITHGATRHGRQTPEYKSWAHAKDRCQNPSDAAYMNYGGRGIRMHEAWLESFETFLRDVGRRPTPQHTLDRYPNNNGNYEPGNVRWATRQQQANNQRRNVRLTHAGSTRTLSEWAFHLGMGWTTLFYRLHRGWTVDRALTSIANRKFASR